MFPHPNTLTAFVSSRKINPSSFPKKIARAHGQSARRDSSLKRFHVSKILCVAPTKRSAQPQEIPGAQSSLNPQESAADPAQDPPPSCVVRSRLPRACEPSHPESQESNSPLLRSPSYIVPQRAAAAATRTLPTSSDCITSLGKLLPNEHLLFIPTLGHCHLAN